MIVVLWECAKIKVLCRCVRKEELPQCSLFWIKVGEVSSWRRCTDMTQINGWTMLKCWYVNLKIVLCADSKLWEYSDSCGNVVSLVK